MIPFLELVESLRISKSWADSDLIESAGDLFELEAWTWWNNNSIKNRFNDWNDPVVALKLTFVHKMMTLYY